MPTSSITAERADLREAVRAVFYPAIPLDDQLGQSRVDRSTERLIDALGIVEVPDA